jgi:hypothetical protein
VAVAHDWFERLRASFQPSPFTGKKRRRHPSLIVAAGQITLTAVISTNEETATARSGLTSAVLWMPAPDDSPFSSVAMYTLSRAARFVLDRMEPGRRYDVLDLRAFVPNASAEGLREVMHELWINRQIERVGYSGWQRHRPAPGHLGVAPAADLRQTKVVKPEDLFDHDTFPDFFR